MIATTAAKRTGKPVKALYDQSHFHGIEEGFGVYYCKIGFKNDGKITAIQIHYIGACTGGIIAKLYEATGIPNIKCTDSTPHINRGGNGPLRASSIQCSVVTMIFEHVAGELGMDPTKVAIINDGCQGKDMAWVNENVKKVQGFDPARDSLKEVMEAGKKAIDWDKKWHLPGTKILPNGKYHGIGCMWIEAWAVAANDNRKIGLTLRRDGTINILARRAECGTHGTSAHSQLVADEMGMRYGDVQWRPFDDPGFDAAAGGGSLGMLRNAPIMIGMARKM
jgi:CO/xanthine dehydrogenase Mo-binding subunit